jgi:hypothetical protein
MSSKIRSSSEIKHGGAKNKLCITRALQNVGYLRSKNPSLFLKGEPIAAKWGGDYRQLMQLHTLRPDLIEVREVSEQLAKTKIPLLHDQAVGPLFNGTLYFVQITFTGGGGGATTLNSTDLNTAKEYASFAVNPICTYANWYGTGIGSTARISVSSTPLSFSVNASGNYGDSDLQGWIDQIVNDNKLQAGGGSCIIIMNDITGSIQNNDADPVK